MAEEGREVAASQRETKCGAIGRGQAHRGGSKTGVRARGSQNKHISGGASSESCLPLDFQFGIRAVLLFPCHER